MLSSHRLSFRILLSVCVLGIMGVLVGCAATHTAVSKRNLVVETKMSATIFLDPVSPDKKTVFVQVRNTSDKPQLEIGAQVTAALINKGYQIVQDPAKAHYLLQANILKAGQTDLRATEDALKGGYGGAIVGGLGGAATGALVSNSSKAPLAGALIGSVLGTVADAMIKDTMYSVVSDLQISERVGKSVHVKEETRSVLKQGTSGTKEVSSTERVDWKRYQTRIISEANQVNLKFEKAVPELVSGLTRSIAGIF